MLPFEQAASFRECFLGVRDPVLVRADDVVLGCTGSHASAQSGLFTVRRNRAAAHELARDESYHGAAEVDFIAGLEAEALGRAVDFLSQTVAHHPQPAVAVGFAARRIPAVVE